MKEVKIRNFPKLGYNEKEALNTLCTNLLISADGMKKIVVTSCRPKEGKSFITINLMRALASIGKKVVMVDADLRVSMLASHHLNDKGPETNLIGLAQYLYIDCDIEDILYKTDIPRADLIPAGGKTINSLPLLSSPRLKKLLDALEPKYDVVLVDAPPVGVIIDAVEIAKVCNGVLVVVENNKIGAKELADAVEQLRLTDRKILGTVLNKVSFKKRSVKNYYYRAYYSHYGSYSFYYHGKNPSED